ncbi:hypothetical protein BK131_04655 [Paenibacillus amylolyticus]|uniref:Uncharacterized protein n=1 Tax=Paenibacillus amylolyticus TaxID=1451 RepID=A0A1R1C5C2_PAEAM|nr:hypothetical protein BK131_04655 [Paenibacillus amylolyticus]
MPTLDNYSLSNYGLGSKQENFQLVTPSISQTITVNPGVTGNLITISTFTSASLISATALSSGSSRIYYVAPAGVTCALFLIDGLGELWQISPGAGAAGIFSAQVSNSGAVAIYSNGDSYLNSSSKLASSLAKPTNFNMSAPMTLCIYVLSNSLSSASTVNVSVSGIRIVSL